MRTPHDNPAFDPRAFGRHGFGPAGRHHGFGGHHDPADALRAAAHDPGFAARAAHLGGPGGPFDPRDFPGFPPPRPGFPGGPGFPPAVPGFPPGHGPWDKRGRKGHRRSRDRGGRQRRGNVRAAVLKLLAERPMHGYEIIQEITERSGGYWRPSPGSVYPTLQMLADEGLVSTDESAKGKKLFELTDDGKAEAEKIGEAPWEAIADEIDPVDVELRTAHGSLHAAVFQIGMAADAEQKARAVRALTEARQQLYLILAESGAPATAPGDVNADDTDDVDIDDVEDTDDED